MHIGNWRITTHSEFFPNNIHDQIAQRQNYEMEKRELERQRKAMEIQETQRKWADAMVKPIEKAQRQESVNSIPVNLQHQEAQWIRTKALELAVSLFKTSLAPTTDTADVVAVAQRFYSYITKGE